MRVRPAACIIKNHKILLMRYEYGGESVYNFPGGNQENKESLLETLVRELEEELGLTISVEHLLMVGEVHSNDQKDSVLHCVFQCKMLKNEPKINRKETSAIEIVWVELADINALNLYPNIGKELLITLNNKANEVYIGKIDQPWY